MQLLQAKFDISKWLTSPMHVAVAQNLFFDSHVSAEREQVFDTFLEQSNGDWQRALAEYQERRVRGVQNPDYADHVLNGGNILMSDSRQFIAGELALARVLNLSRLGPLFQWAKVKDFRQFESLPAATTDELVGKWLNSKLLESGESGRMNFIAALLEVLNEFPRTSPAWVTTLESIAPYALDGADRWAEVSAMNPGAPGAWIIVLSYSVDEAVGKNGVLAMPTVLDAGLSPYFFPSPPLARVGHSMDLGADGRYRQLIPEFIHGRISHKIEHWERTGRMLDQTTRLSMVDLTTQRRAHRELLQRAYGDAINSWMPLEVIVTASDRKGTSER